MLQCRKIKDSMIKMLNSVAWSTVTSMPENNGAEQQFNNLKMHNDLAKQNTLNPNAAEFVPAVRKTAESL